MYQPPKHRLNGDLKWFGLDFDRTIADNTGAPDYTPTDPLPDAHEKTHLLTARGWKLIIFTARPWSEYELVESWLLHHDIPFRRIVCGKPLFRYYMDDINIEFRGWANFQVPEDPPTGDS